MATPNYFDQLTAPVTSAATIAGKIDSVMPKPMANPVSPDYTKKQKMVMNPSPMAAPNPNAVMTQKMFQAATALNGNT